MQQIILSIAGKPGLYKLVTRGNNNLIVEALDGTHKRMPAFSTDRITSLNDIAMFTEVLPEWDRDRVQNSHIKKLISWYNILVENGLTDFKEEAEASETEEAK